MRKLSVKFMVYIFLIVLSAAGLLLLLSSTVSWEAWPGILLLFLLIALATSFRVQDPMGIPIFPITTLIYAAIFIYGPGTTFFITGFGTTLSYILTSQWPTWRVAFNGAQLGLSATLASLTFHVLGGKAGTPPSVPQIPAVIAAVMMLQVANSFFVGFFRSSLRRTSLISIWLAIFGDLFGSNLLSAPLAVLLAILYIKIHPLTLLVFLISLPFQRQAFKLYFERQKLYAEAIEALVIATDVNFPQASGHSRRVADMSVALAREMRLADPDVETIQVAALLHDVGMIGLDDLLENPANLSQKDQSRLRDHVLMGAEITRELPRRDIAKMVLGHHEHYDGTGYPQGLQGKEIPLGARIISVAEAYENMISGYLPYRDKHPPEEALRFITNQAGSIFDPEVVQAFIRASQNGAIPSPIEGDKGSSPLMGDDTGVGEGYRRGMACRAPTPVSRSGTTHPSREGGRRIQ